MDAAPISAWFNGPKAENGELLEHSIRRIAQDYNAWRRNYYPEDGVALDSAQRRLNEPFNDAFEDRLIELLALLKSDFPFQSPRYAAHMIAEQTLPSIAGYFAAMLYNPNNVSAEAAPVTARLELEAAQMISRMVGYDDHAWAHLCSGGTVATLEALWAARTVKLLPLIVRAMRDALGLPLGDPGATQTERIRVSPILALASLAQCFDDAAKKLGPTSTQAAIDAFRASKWNVVEHGMASVTHDLGARLAVLAPETAHYCFAKSLDILGLGRNNLVLVKVDSDFRMRIDDLRTRLDALEEEGRVPMAVVAVVGSTEEGAVDPVDEIIELRDEREKLGLSSFWLHADAAYGGYLKTITIPTRLGLGADVTKTRIGTTDVELPLRLPHRYACDALERLSDCDSVTIDPHKLGYIPYPAGAICFKSNLVKPVLRQEAAYIAEPSSSVEVERKSEGIGMYILEGSKPGAAAASVWLSHKLVPLDNTGHGVLVRNAVRSACELHALLEAFPERMGIDGLRYVALCPPGSNILCFAIRPEGTASLGDLNAFNSEIYDRFTVPAGEGRRVYDQPFFLSRTTLSPRQYSPETVADFLRRYDVDESEYAKSGVFLLRSVLMNPWYGDAKRRGRYFLSEMVEAIFEAAMDIKSRSAAR